MAIPMDVEDPHFEGDDLNKKGPAEGKAEAGRGSLVQAIAGACDAYRKKMRSRDALGLVREGLRCAVCTSDRTFKDLTALMAHAKAQTKLKISEHSAFHEALASHVRFLESVDDKGAGCETSREVQEGAARGEKGKSDGSATKAGASTEMTCCYNDESKVSVLRPSTQEVEAMGDPKETAPRPDGTSEQWVPAVTVLSGGNDVSHSADVNNKGVLLRDLDDCVGDEEPGPRKAAGSHRTGRGISVCTDRGEGSKRPPILESVQAAGDDVTSELEVGPLKASPALRASTNPSFGSAQGKLLKSIEAPEMLANVNSELAQGEGPESIEEERSGAENAERSFDRDVRAFHKELQKRRESCVRARSVVSRQLIRCTCLVCNTEEYESLSALRKHARNCQKEPRQHAALCVAITLEKHGAGVTTEAETVGREDAPGSKAEPGVIERGDTKNEEKVAIKTDENEARVPNREYKEQKRKRGDTETIRAKGDNDGDGRAEQVRERGKKAKSRHREQQSLRAKEKNKRGSDGHAGTKRKSGGGSEATEPGTGNLQKEANGV
jgi:hypothetical protein